MRSNLATIFGGLWLAFGPGPGHATESFERRYVPLVSCQSALQSKRSGIDRALVRQLSLYTLNDQRRQRGFIFLGEGRPAPRRAVEIPELKYDSRNWRRETWRVNERSYSFLDVGPKHLEDDSHELNTLIMAQMMEAKGHSLTFRASKERARDLLRLTHFREAAITQMLLRYPNMDLTALLAASRENSNADLLAIADHELAWDATPEEIQGSLRHVVQIFYDQPFDYVRPSLDGLLAVVRAQPTAPRTLPVVERLRLGADFWRRYGHLRLCEVSPFPLELGSQTQLVRRLLSETFGHVRRRGCDAVISSALPSEIARLRRYGFRLETSVKVANDQAEFVMVLPVKSPEFLSMYTQLRQEVHGE